MKVLILGSRGYIGRKIGTALLEDGINVLGFSREEIDFDDPDAEEKLFQILEENSPNLLINAIGSIDSQVGNDSQRLFNSILRPTYGIFRYYSNHLFAHTSIYILGSSAAGHPRRSYPLYAALKYAEEGLSLTASEVFQDSSIEWRIFKLSRLRGGLGKDGGHESPLNLNNEELVSLSVRESDPVLAEFILHLRLEIKKMLSDERGRND